MIGVNWQLRKATDLGYHDCLPEVQKIIFKLNDLIDVIHKKQK